MNNMLLFHWIMLHICIVGTLSQNAVRGVVGQAVILPCTYSVRQPSDLTVMCWGRGSCPNSKCSSEILRTDGRRVTSKKSHRYLLKGYVTRGDVSLTIENLNERDKGLYCCRIEIMGWFNDIKKTLTLQVERATTTVSTTTITTTSQMTTTTLTTAALTTTPPTPRTFLLTTEPAFPTTPTATSALPLSTSSLSTAIAVTTAAPSFLLTTKSAFSVIPTVTDGLTLPISSMSTVMEVTTTVPSFPLTTKSASATTSSATDDFILPTSSGSTAIGFLANVTPLVNTKSSPTTFQNESIKNDFVTTEIDPPATGQTFLEFSKKYYPVLIPCALVICIVPLILVVWRMKRKKLEKYKLEKMESLKKQEESEQTLIGTEGENGLFPL